MRSAFAAVAAMLSACAAETDHESALRNVNSGQVLNDIDKPVEADDPPGGGLSFEWSANGFEQLPADFAWMGSGGDEPGVTLAVPETDNFVWISDCDAGRVRTYLALQPERLKRGNKTVVKFETDTGGNTRVYPVIVEKLPYGDGGSDSVSPVLILPTSDPMFTELKSGDWAYIQVDEGDDAAKLRVSLKGAREAWDLFLPACKGQES